jgi:hypothetical protein
MYFLMTVDVEGFSIPLGTCDDDTGVRVFKDALPLMLDLFSKHDILATFFFTGSIAEDFPDAVQEVLDHGHEIGCHGYTHVKNRALDVLNYEEQVKDIWKAKNVLSDIAGRVESFRAPSLRLNESTIRALETTKFRNDSSICSRRLIAPFTVGWNNKMNCMFAPRGPYFLSYDSIFKKGESSIFEIPISGFIFPYCGTVLRRSPLFLKLLQKYLVFESQHAGNPLNFLIHPSEFIPVDQTIMTGKTSLSEKIKHRIIIKNFGEKCVTLFDDLLYSIDRFDPDYVDVRSFRADYGGKDEYQD